MNEFITTGLINLYALLASFSADSEKARIKVKDFLNKSLGRRSADEFLGFFDEFLEYYASSDIKLSKVQEIANGIYENLKQRITRKELILTYVRLIELLEDGEDKLTQSLIDEISNVFNIESTQKDELCKFIFRPNDLNASDKVILVSNSNDSDFKHYIQRNVKGNLFILHDAKEKITIVRLIGSDDLFIESRSLKSLAFQNLESGDTISGSNLLPVSFTDIIRRSSKDDSKDKIIFESDTIEFRFKSGDYGLRSFSFYEESGSMIAIMGSSGSGKTTLLNLLNGTLHPSKGNIYINGFNIHLENSYIEGMIGYVPQEDMLIEDLTVFQNLFFCAKLSFSDLSGKEIYNKIIGVLTQLELLSIKDLKVGNCLNKTISGGQRKRLNIALEIIRDSAILLVDEPTSGLSSSDSEKVIQLLREQANAGKLIMVNIHQPSSLIFRMFDSLWIVDSGYMIFKR
jgi:ABC-type multidrug transport system ATPase subunit